MALDEGDELRTDGNPDLEAGEPALAPVDGEKSEAASAAPAVVGPPVVELDNGPAAEDESSSSVSTSAEGEGLDVEELSADVPTTLVGGLGTDVGLFGSSVVEGFAVVTSTVSPVTPVVDGFFAVVEVVAGLEVVAGFAVVTGFFVVVGFTVEGAAVVCTVVGAGALLDDSKAPRSTLPPATRLAPE